MWSVAFASLALVYAWPGPFVLIKPTLAPFALIGITRRWWAGLAAFALLCVPFAGMWADWLHVVLDSGGATYPFGDYATMLLPLAVIVQVRLGHGAILRERAFLRGRCAPACQRLLG